MKPSCSYCHQVILEARDFFSVNGIPVHVGCVQPFMGLKEKKSNNNFIRLDPKVFWGEKPREEWGQEKPVKAE